VVYTGEILPGEQKSIIDHDLFEAGQAKLAEQQNNISLHVIEGFVVRPYLPMTVTIG